MKIWLNGKVVNDKDAKVSIFDRGFLYGDGVFETVRSYDGAVFMPEAHLDRLFNSFKITQIKIPYSKSFLKRQIYRLLKINKLGNAYIRLTVTRGTGTIGLAGISCENPTVVIITKKFTPYPAAMYKQGITVKIVRVRQNENTPASGIKAISFLNYILARLEAKKDGFDDAIMLNSKARVSESTVSNIFMVKKRQLMTPSLENGILPGITRKIIIKVAAGIGLNIKEKAITPQQLYNADEVFLTSSLMEVMPVVKVGGRIIGTGRPGMLTREIHSRYRGL